VSLVSGLFMADSLAQLMQTEFNGLFWWDLRNGGDSYGGNISASLYGWRLYGDYGVLEGTNLYPPYYTAKLMQNFVQAGDTVITAASDYSLLPTYAVRRLNGSLTVLAINKDPVHTLMGEASVMGFIPASGGTVYSYGIPQDTAVENGTGSPDVAQTDISITGTNISYAFPPYSATVLALSPAPANLLAISTPPTASQFVFQLQGQVGVPYVLQSSTNLITWKSLSTNTLLASTLNITNALALSPTQVFWRVIWQP
jgi:alpha-N-arabinofuranosidase